MEGTAYQGDDEESEAEKRREEQDESGIRTEFERMMFEFNPDEGAGGQQPAAAPSRPAIEPEPPA